MSSFTGKNKIQFEVKCKRITCLFGLFIFLLNFNGKKIILIGSINRTLREESPDYSKCHRCLDTILCHCYANVGCWPIQVSCLGWSSSLWMVVSSPWGAKKGLATPEETSGSRSEFPSLKDSSTSAASWLKAEEPLGGANDWPSLHFGYLQQLPHRPPNLGAGSGCLIIYVIMDEPGIVCPSNGSLRRATVSPCFICGFFPVRRKAFHSTFLQTERWRKGCINCAPRWLPFYIKKYADFWVSNASHQLPMCRTHGRNPGHHECFSG